MNCEGKLHATALSGNAVVIINCCGNTELGWRRNRASEINKHFASTELSFFSRRRVLPLQNPHFHEPQTVKYYLHPSDSDGCRLLVNSLCLVENLHFVLAKRSIVYARPSAYIKFEDLSE